MASQIFRFYSLEPRKIFKMAGERWPSAVVRRDALSVGGSPVWYSILVLDDREAADEFASWLAEQAPRRDIRAYVGHARSGDEAVAYADAMFHVGSAAAHLRLFAYQHRQWIAALLRRGCWAPFRLSRRLKS